MARASRNRRTRGRASVVGPSAPAALPRAYADTGVGFVSPSPSPRPFEAFRRNAEAVGFRARLNAALASTERDRRWVYVGRYPFVKVSAGQLRREALSRADRERKRAQYQASWSQVFKGLRYVDPRRVLTCVKRKIRREVLYALGKAGRSGGSPGKWRGVRRTYRRTTESQYSC